MEQYLEKIVLSIQRIDSLKSLTTVFDLIHEHYSKKKVPRNFESLDEVYKAQGELYLLILSFIYSLFDKKGINIVELSMSPISKSAKNELDAILTIWKPLSKHIARIRHNLGFHGGKMNQMVNGINALKVLDENPKLLSIAILIKMLFSFSKTLEHEIDY